MHLQTLYGRWEFCQAVADNWLPATVPGSVHTDLLALDRIPDPFVGDNELHVQWVAETDWEYRCVFTLDALLLAEDRIELICAGLDTLAEVTLNGHLLGRVANMFHPHGWEVKSLLRAGENMLHIRFTAPTRAALENDRRRHLPGTNHSIPGGQYMRKAPSHFGWDWGPKLPPIGIWREVRLLGYSHARLDDVHLRQQHVDGKVIVTAALTVETVRDTPRRVMLRLTAPDGRVQTIETALDANSTRLDLEVDRPRLWWPNGYGDQPLYQVEILLCEGGLTLDRRVYSIGLRTVELRQEDDRWGRSFTFVVNGVPIFAKGANWIPADSFPTRITDRQLEHLISSGAAAHFNMLRVWGGGYYESETFYDLCDRYGLLVWQDFMFACAVYPLNDPAYVQNIHEEVTQAVRRLRQRACLALWCGNNEMEVGWAHWGWSRPDTQDLKAADQQFFYDTLPAWVRALDPDHAYWPSSPSSNTPHEAPHSSAVGDDHLWEVWHALKPIRFYREQLPRFASEFGFEALPSPSTIAAYADPSEWNMTSYVMEHHQRHPGGNGKIVTYLTEHFRLPDDFESLVYLTQVLQAEALRTGVEHWRRHRDRCSGTLYWQLNDCWPVASWSSIDYYGRWKALHYAAKRFYAPVLLSIDSNDARMDVFITNDTTREWHGEVRWSLETLAGDVKQSSREPIVAAPLATTPVKSLDFAACLDQTNQRDIVFVCELWHGDERMALSTSLWVPDKHARFAEPHIQSEVRSSDTGLTIELRSQSLARFVELSLDGADVVFSDNYFDLPAHRTVHVACPLPEGWSVEQVRQALKIRSLRATY